MPESPIVADVTRRRGVHLTGRLGRSGRGAVEEMPGGLEHGADLKSYVGGKDLALETR
jgi:hypothetical protein